MSELKQFCMVMKINVDCNACFRKLRRIILKMKAIETHMIEKERYSYRVIVFGRFKPSDIAIKIRKKMNRRVEILDYEEMEPAAAAADANQNPPPPLPDQIPQPPSHNHNHQIPMFPSLEHDHHHRRPPPMFPTLAANEYRSFSSSRSDFAVTRFPEPDMDQRFWHYGYEYSEDTDSAYSLHNYYEY